jgi:hypothetical protein
VPQWGSLHKDWMLPRGYTEVRDPLQQAHPALL